MRLFVALEIPRPVRDNLGALISSLRALDAPSSKHGARWVRPENLHVTMKFIGAVATEKLDAIRSALSDVRSSAPVDLRFRNAGFFPSEKRPRVLWVGTEASANLAQLAAEIDQQLAKLGILPEKRPFTPHLTLARFDPLGISETLRIAIQQDSARDFGALRTGEFHLIQSKLKASGADYATLQSFQFAAHADTAA